jgi:energy-coupling factor transporter ATP-binding protein EcfA2
MRRPPARSHHHAKGHAQEHSGAARSQVAPGTADTQVSVGQIRIFNAGRSWATLTVMTSPPEWPHVLSVQVRDYKNIRCAELPWSDVVVLFGANGSGKTNFLETLALLFGTDRTLALVGERAVLPAPNALSYVAVVSARQLPFAPDVAARLRGIPELEPRVASDLEWWSSLGVTSGASFSSALIDAGVPAGIVALLAPHLARPTIRYRLAMMTEYRAAARTFDRTWLVDQVPEKVLDVVHELPTPFQPLKDWASRGDFTRPADLMHLPAVSAGPVRLEWLPRARTSEEVTDDLVASFDAALPDAQSLAEQIAFLDLGVGEADPDAYWWLHEIGARAASDELSRTMRSISVASRGDNPAEWAVFSATHELGTTRDDAFLDHLSSGERRWADEAMATIARAITDHGHNCAWKSFVWARAEEAALEQLSRQLRTDVAPLVEEDGFIGAEALSLVNELFASALRRAATEWLSDEPGRSELAMALVPALESLAEPALTVRAFDEPDAHLHPSAQRRIREALSSLGRFGSVVMASHSPYLLSHPEWTYLKVDEGIAHPLTPEDVAAGHRFAQTVGLTTGELLVSTNLILVVEGRHDLVFLEELYGDDLRTAGVVILPMHGTDNAMSLVDSEFWLRYSSIPFAIMFDNVRLERVDDRRLRKKDLTDEEWKLRLFGNRLASQRRSWHRIGLKRPDITAYLDASLFPDLRFPGWDAVISEFRGRNEVGFKAVVAKHGPDLRDTRVVERYARTMRERQLRPPRELERRLHEVCALAATGQIQEP